MLYPVRYADPGLLLLHKPVPGGNVHSTLTDFEAFGKALLNESFPLFQEKETWKVFFTPTAYLGNSEIPSSFHGLWTIPYEVVTVGHGGNTAGCSSYLLLDIQDGVGAVIMFCWPLNSKFPPE